MAWSRVNAYIFALALLIRGIQLKGDTEAFTAQIVENIVKKEIARKMPAAVNHSYRKGKTLSGVHLKAATDAINKLVDESIVDRVQEAEKEVSQMLLKSIEHHIQDAGKVLLKQDENQCRDKLESCDRLAIAGVCETSKDAMVVNCPSTCSFCEMLDDLKKQSEKENSEMEKAKLKEKKNKAKVKTKVLNKVAKAKKAKKIKHKKVSSFAPEEVKLIHQNLLDQAIDHANLPMAVSNGVSSPESSSDSLVESKANLSEDDASKKEDEEQTEQQTHDTDEEAERAKEIEAKKEEEKLQRKKKKAALKKAKEAKAAKAAAMQAVKEAAAAKEAAKQAAKEAAKQAAKEAAKQAARESYKAKPSSILSVGDLQEEEIESQVTKVNKNSCNKISPFNENRNDDKIIFRSNALTVEAHYYKTHCHPLCARECLSSCAPKCCAKSPKIKKHCHPMCKKICLPSCGKGCCAAGVVPVPLLVEGMCPPGCPLQCAPQCLDTCCSGPSSQLVSQLTPSSSDFAQQSQNLNRNLLAPSLCFGSCLNSCDASCPSTCCPNNMAQQCGASCPVSCAPQCNQQCCAIDLRLVSQPPPSPNLPPPPPPPPFLPPAPMSLSSLPSLPSPFDECPGTCPKKCAPGCDFDCCRPFLDPSIVRQMQEEMLSPPKLPSLTPTIDLPQQFISNPAYPPAAPPMSKVIHIQHVYTPQRAVIPSSTSELPASCPSECQKQCGPACARDGCCTDKKKRKRDEVLYPLYDYGYNWNQRYTIPGGSVFYED